MVKCLKCKKEMGKSRHLYCYDCYFGYRDDYREKGKDEDTIKEIS